MYETIFALAPLVLLLGVTFYGTNKTKLDDPSSDNILDPGQMKGKVRAMTDDYTIVGTEVTGDLIHMGEKMPTGARVIDIILHTGACGSGAKLDVGDAEDDNRYISAVDVSGAIVPHLEAAEIAGRHYKIDMTTPSTPDNQVIVKVNAADTVLTADAVIKLTVLYVIE